MIEKLNSQKTLDISERVYLVKRGAELRQLRQKAKLSVKTLAPELGVTPYIIENLENGRQRREDIIDKYVELCNKAIEHNEQNTCVLCGSEIPEGRQICPNCEVDK